MPRGRRPSEHAYRGQTGETRRTQVHVTTTGGGLVTATVVDGIDAVADPDLARAFLDGSDFNHVQSGGATIRLAIPVVYHDPAAEVLVLVLPEEHRHRELEERINLLERMIDDDSPIPPYAKEFAVVFGADGLRAWLERRAETALEEARLAEMGRTLEQRRADLDRRAAEMDRKDDLMEQREAEIERVRIDVDRQKRDVASRESALERRAGEVAATAREAENAVRIVERAATSSVPTSGPVAAKLIPDLAAKRQTGEPTIRTVVEQQDPEEDTNPFADLDAHVGAPTVVTHVPTAPDPDVALATQPLRRSQPMRAATPAPVVSPDLGDTGADPITTTCEDLAIDGGVGDPWLAAFEAGTAPYQLAATPDGVRLAVRVAEASAPGLAADGAITNPLDLRLVLHRTDHYPVIAMVVGPPGAIRNGQPAACAIALLDIGADVDRGALAQLAKNFQIAVDLIAGGRRFRRVSLRAPLEDNTSFILRAADDHVRNLLADSEPSVARARQMIAAPGFDLFGSTHEDSAEFRDDKLGQLGSANAVRRALAMARRFTKPAREDYLVCVRGFPLPRWRHVRMQVLARAMEWGLWMGPELAQVAVSEGFARSRRDLVGKLAPAFEALRQTATFDLDADAADDNLNALVEEARVLGVDLGGSRPRTIDSQDLSQASGTIEPSRPKIDTKTRSVDELIGLLDQRSDRLGAAIELCERGDVRALGPVMAAVKKMSRSEAVRVLGVSVRFGAAAAPALMEGLASSKAYLRHGCALALAMLRTELGTEAVIELLLTEPTEIWREVARAVGQVGPPALMPLASQFGRLGDRATASARERVSWAMAHVGVRGGRTAVEALAGGASVVAPVARTALDLMSSAARDEVRVRSPGGGTSPGREVTVNRAFSRRFFEALEKGLPEVAHAELSAMDASEPMELLDDDLLEDDADDLDIVDEESELDENDIIAS
jgi:hypothetical protein